MGNITLTGYRLHDKKRKEQRTLVGKPHSASEEKFREGLREELKYKGKLTPQYARSGVR